MRDSFASTIVLDLKHIAASLSAELRHIASWVREPGLWLLLMLGLVLWSLAYALPYSAMLHIGGDQRTGLRKYDAPFLVDFNASQPDDGKQPEWSQRAEAPYRWSEDQAAIQIPGLGRGQWHMRLRISGQPDQQDLLSRWSVNEQQAFDVQVAPGPRIYHFLSNSSSGDIQLRVATPRLNAPGDPRNLGLVFYSLQATATSTRILLPAVLSLALLLTMLTLVYGLQRRLGSGRVGERRELRGWSKTNSYQQAETQNAVQMQHRAFVSAHHGGFTSYHSTFLVGFVFILITARLLVIDRVGLTIWLVSGAGLLALCYLLVMMGEALLVHFTPPYISPQERGMALGTVIVGFAIRMGGLLHPYALNSDLGLHIHNLNVRMALGQVFQTAGLPCEAGAGLAPYPPAQSIILLPGLLFSIDEAWLGLWLRGANALLESAGAVFIWLLLRRAGMGGRVALIGAGLYTVAPPLLGAYSIGEMANIFGQIWLPPLLLVLFLIAQSPKLRAHHADIHSPFTIYNLPFLVLLLLLSHTGVTISTLALLGVWWLLGLGSTPWRRQLLIVASWLVVIVLAMMLFYSAYTYLPEHNRLLAAERLAADPTALCPPELAFDIKLWRTLMLGLGPQGSLTFPLVLAAAIGTWLSPGGALRRVLLAAWLGTFLSFATLLTSAQPVRWSHFLFPALCIAAAIGLGRWMRRGLAGQLLAWALLAYILFFGLERWVLQLATYLH